MHYRRPGANKTTGDRKRRAWQSMHRDTGGPAAGFACAQSERRRTVVELCGTVLRRDALCWARWLRCLAGTLALSGQGELANRKRASERTEPNANERASQPASQSRRGAQGSQFARLSVCAASQPASQPVTTRIV